MTNVRHLARQRALQLLYALEYAAEGENPLDVMHKFLAADPLHRRGWGPFARSLVEKVWAERAELDEQIRPMLRRWTLERLPMLDRICLRLALCELRDFPDIPMRVTINEYIDISRQFGTDESPQYINAVLDKLARDFPQKDFQAKEPLPPPPPSPPTEEG